MKGIYLTQESKQEIEARIDELEKDYFKLKGNDDPDEHYLDGARTYLKNILASATILPVESNMSYVKSYDFVDEFDEEYPNGVIIQPKKP